MNILLISIALFLVLITVVWKYYTVQKKLNSINQRIDNYNSIIEQANDMMFVIDIVDGKILQSNPSAARLLGYSEAELARLSLFDLHPKEYLETSSAIVADVWEKGGLIYTDVPFITSGGEIFPVECSAKVAPFNGRPAIIIYARNIAERLKMEKQINEQRRVIDEKSKDILDSIEYSKRIQRSILIEKEKIKTFAPDSFILFMPRDVVSGDFYWLINYELKRDVISESGTLFKAGSRVLVIAAVDCTGHGVPGAFMSIIGNTLLDQTTRNPEIRSPAVALDYVNAGLKRNLNKNSEDMPLRDGMDIALCSINMDELVMEYAGANNPVYIIRNSELIILSSDKQPLTASPDGESRPFTNKVFTLRKNDCIYLFTDGYADQFGGEKEKKFLYKRFKELLVEVSVHPMEVQRGLLKQRFLEWKGSLEQVDDVLVIGIRV